MILISGDAHHNNSNNPYKKIEHKNAGVKIWDIQQLINKKLATTPWYLNCSYSLPNAHEEGITSLNYLSKSHKILTTSLDGTVKIWEIRQKPFTI